MLEFNIKNQTISRVDRFNPATDSVDYLTAKFNFITDDWDGVTKKALFRSGTVSYEAAISASGVCKVPFEVLVSPENKFSALSGGCIKIFVSVVGTSGTMTIPTKECRVEIGASGLNETLNGAAPTPNIYEQFVDTIKADNDTTVAEIKADNDETRGEVEALTERAETAQTSAEQSAASMKNDYANALKGKVSGEVVRVDDVSPVEHNPVVKVRSKNLLPYPYHTTESSKNGGVFTVQSDGGIVASGTPTDYSHITLYSGKALCNSGVVTASISGSFENISCDLILKDSNSNIVETCGFTPPYQYSGTVNLDEYPTATTWSLAVKRAVNDKEMSGVVYPKIELGGTATEYTPYIDPSTVTLTRCGKNFADISIVVTDDQNQVVNNGDGTITVNTTATSSAVPMATVTLKRLAPQLKVGETYTLSAKSTGTQKKIWLQETNYTWDFGTSAIITEEMLNSHIFVYASGNSTTATISNVQIEVGNIATDYEAYKGAGTYTPETDGTCDIVSLSPTMTLFTDTEGVTVECEYNRDINKVIADILKKVGA